MSPVLIGVTGLARSGKDTVAGILQRELGPGVERYAFAEPLKTMLKSVFGDHFHTGDRSGICPEAGITYRKLMQTLGTEWGREQVNPNLWVNLVHKRWMRHVNDGTTGMVLSDVRFDSEAEWLIYQGGLLIEVLRPQAGLGKPQLSAWGRLRRWASFAADWSPGEHISEAGVSPQWERITIHNNGSLRDLEEQVRRVVWRLRNHNQPIY